MWDSYLNGLSVGCSKGLRLQVSNVRYVQTVRSGRTGEAMSDSSKDATATEVRSSWAMSLNAAAERRPVIFHRGDQDFALLPASLLRDVLRRAVPAPEVIAEDDGWTVLLPGHPVAADGTTLDEALHDFVHALRDYAEAWDERLHRAPNHQHAAALVQHVSVTDDDELLAWARGPYDQAALEKS